MPEPLLPGYNSHITPSICVSLCRRALCVYIYTTDHLTDIYIYIYILYIWSGAYKGKERRTTWNGV